VIRRIDHAALLRVLCKGLQGSASWLFPVHEIRRDLFDVLLVGMIASVDSERIALPGAPA
jgi:hypothetical protein